MPGVPRKYHSPRTLYAWSYRRYAGLGSPLLLKSLTYSLLVPSGMSWYFGLSTTHDCTGDSSIWEYVTCSQGVVGAAVVGSCLVGFAAGFSGLAGDFFAGDDDVGSGAGAGAGLWLGGLLRVSLFLGGLGGVPCLGDGGGCAMVGNAGLGRDSSLAFGGAGLLLLSAPDCPGWQVLLPAEGAGFEVPDLRQSVAPLPLSALLTCFG